MFKFKNIILIVVACIAVMLVLFRSDQVVSFVGKITETSDNVTNVPVTLHADEKGHFFGSLSINGVTLKYIVDSGASNVTLNSRDAKRAKIDYTNGFEVDLLTPGGEVRAFSLKLNGLMIGATRLDDVEATVVEGTSPPYVLLGISAQKKLDVKRDNSVMTLGKKD